jgi:glucokinase
VSELALGVDVGGTKMLGCVLDPERPGTVLVEHRVDTPVGAVALIDGLAELAAALLAEVSSLGPDPSHPAGAVGSVGSAGAVGSVGVGLPALVDHDSVLRFAPHLPGVTDLAVGRLLDARVGLPVTVDNDANCAVVAEAAAGAAVGRREVLMITLGTGIGGGIITGGRLLRGARGFAGEPGHMTVQRNGVPCPCGQRGCWECYASGRGLGHLAREAASEGRAPSVLARAGGLDEIRGEHVVDAAADGDPGALAVMAEFGWWVAVGLANLANLLDPEVIVLGGGLVDAGDVLLDPVRRSYGTLTLGGGHREPPPIEPARLGSSAGAIGAALVGAQRR